jgi:hypothetical protein
MLRRTTFVLALAALLVPSVRASEWEEDYTSEEWMDESPPPEAPRADESDLGGIDADAPPVSLATFESSLSPYGDWVVVGAYGRVWRPHVAAGWRPYYYGRWEWTSEGWLWVSEEPFGWAAYHYGRWTLHPGYGWIWVPGYQWAPAWVSWRYSGDVVGWAPLGPGVSVYVGVTSFVDSWWTFVPCRSFVAEPVHRIAFARTHVRHHYRSTTPAPPRPAFHGGGRVAGPAWGGPPPRAIEQRIGRPITPVRVVAAPSPGAARRGNGEVSVYRPGLRPGAPAARPSPAPRAASPGAAPAQRGERPFVEPRGWATEGRPASRGITPSPSMPRQDARSSLGDAPRSFGGGGSRGMGASGGQPRPSFAPQARTSPAPRASAGDAGGRSHGGAPAPRPAPQGGGRGERDRRR